MKIFLTSAILCLSFFSNAQYYYSDIIGTKETAAILRLYQQNKVSRVVLNSFDADGMKSEGFYVDQVFSPSAQTLKTTTRSGVANESILTTYLNVKGEVIKTIDSTVALVTTALYNYNATGQLNSILSASKDSTIAITQTEEHKWEYEGDRVLRMLRIKNSIDTSIVQFKIDGNGNVIEETSVRKGVKPEPVLYYYDGQNRLTDVVRFNNKARRLLPVFMFEYSTSNQLIQKITIPHNSSDYLIWRYQYGANGLKIREAVYNKQKELRAKLEYQYVFAQAPIP
jgi:antitoxin component YwqK of YwqJK toxin-antitoxin module